MTKSKCEFKIENTLVEINDIDIFIVCKDALVVIENKIKASESKSQLPKYVEIVENGALSHLKANRKRFYVYLTLFEEQASDKRYCDLVEYLKGTGIRAEIVAMKESASKTLLEKADDYYFIQNQDIFHYESQH